MKLTDLMGASGLSAVVDDTSPELGGDLNGSGYASYNVTVKTQNIGQSASHVSNMDPSVYNYFYIEPTANIDLGFNKTELTSNGLYIWFVELKGGGDYLLGWLDNIIWDGGNPPILASGTNKSVISFMTRDGGSNIYAKAAYSEVS